MQTKPKLLLVDDDEDARAALQRTLRHDFKVIEAESAKEALVILSADKEISVVVADEVMPERSGISLLSEVKILYPQMVRVIVSGQVKLEQMMAAINNAEVHRFILKPWENESLRLNLQEALTIHRDLEEIARLRHLSVTDPVTGLTNHRYFQERIRQEMDRSKRRKHCFSLIMVDVDYFKKFNDVHGHPEGDKALAEVARLLKLATRTTDSVSRYGGEEFVILLSETTKDAALEVAERIRADLENATVGGTQKNPHVVTLSLGIASFPDDAQTIDQLVAAADRALYEAKAQGRNRVASFTSALLK